MGSWKVALIVVAVVFGLFYWLPGTVLAGVITVGVVGYRRRHVVGGRLKSLCLRYAIPLFPLSPRRMERLVLARLDELLLVGVTGVATRPTDVVIEVAPDFYSTIVDIRIWLEDDLAVGLAAATSGARRGPYKPRVRIVQSPHLKVGQIGLTPHYSSRRSDSDALADPPPSGGPHVRTGPLAAGHASSVTEAFPPEKTEEYGHSDRPDTGETRSTGQSLALTTVGRSKTFELPCGQSAVLGRGEAADWELDDLNVSRQHCSLWWDGTTLLVTDLGSANGTFHANEPIDQKVIYPPARIRLGTKVVVDIDIRH